MSCRGKTNICFSFSQVFSLLIVAIGVYAKVQKATGTYKDTLFDTLKKVVYYPVLQQLKVNFFIIYYIPSSSVLSSK